MRHRILFGLLLISYIAIQAHAGEQKPLMAGTDVSMLPEIEHAGGVYRNSDGKPGDAIAILRDHGCALFRVRLFVDPATDFNSSYGATQDLKYVRALSHRIKTANGKLLLDLHYSDTWADPGKQFKPARWKDLPFDALVKQVHDYTADVLKTLADDGALPDMVQVGNEITGGILWPDGKVLDAAPEHEAEQWQRFAALLNAGAKAVREAQTSAHRIRIVLHIHGGGKPGLPKWFFEKLNRNPVDYDIVALSFYPAWDDSIDALKQNITEVVTTVGKEVLIAETSYPWHPLPDIKDKPAMRWSQTPDGQKRFLQDLRTVLKDAPEHKAMGFIWWYPEAVPTAPLHIWRNGFEALFDDTGTPLPAMNAFQRSD